MPTQKLFCFTHRNEDIYLFTMMNNKGTVVCITNYGAIITSFKIKMPDGSFNDIVLGFDTVQEYFSENYLTNYAYLGAACGRYCNRIKNGRFQIDKNEYQLTQNMDTDILHGGHEGFDKKAWKANEVSDNAIELSYRSRDGEEGFPGNLETIIRFELNDADELSYEFSATTDQPTAVNLTHHSYFNLNNGAGTIEKQEVKIYGSYILNQDDGLVCDGGLIPVANTIYDFTAFKAIGHNWNKANGYDQCFKIDNKSTDLGLVAEARSKQSGITLQIYSTDPAVQFYSGKGLYNLEGKNGIQYGPFSGFCLETHKHPNAINIPHFPDTVLRPGEKYFQRNIYKIVRS